MPCDELSAGRRYSVDAITQILYNQVSVKITSDKVAEGSYITGFLVAADPISHRYLIVKYIILFLYELKRKPPLPLFFNPFTPELYFTFLDK